MTDKMLAEHKAHPFRLRADILRIGAWAPSCSLDFAKTLEIGMESPEVPSDKIREAIASLAIKKLWDHD